MSSRPQVSFIDYYKRQYNKVVKDLDQPLLVSKAKVKSQAESEMGKEFILIPEFCHLTGLTEAMRNDYK